MTDQTLLAQAKDLSGQITALRRAIHAEPEIGLQTPKTCAKVRAALDHLPLEWREGPSSTGMVGVLRGGKGGSGSVLLRGDMDALPMPEETGLPYASTVPGAMHACGHDAHTAMLAGAAQLLCARRGELAGDVLFMFQPGEEGYHGARHMLNDGLLDPLPQAAFALHVMPNSRPGSITGRAGALLAAADMIEITVEGSGGHASTPHVTRDPVPVACAIVTALQTLVTRQFSISDPVVVTIARIDAGSTHNVIADRAVLTGTMRTLSPENRQRLRDAVSLLAAGIAGAHGLTATTRIEEGFPVTVCDARAVSFGESIAQSLFGADAFNRLPNPFMGAEDFSYVLEKVPGAMFFLGVAPDGDNWAGCCGIHSTRMMIDESIMPKGSAFLASLAEQFLSKGLGSF